MTQPPTVVFLLLNGEVAGVNRWAVTLIPEVAARLPTEVVVWGRSGPMIDELRSLGITRIRVLGARNGRSLSALRRLLASLDRQAVVVAAGHPIAAVLGLRIKGIRTLPVFHIFPNELRARIVTSLVARCSGVLVVVSPAVSTWLQRRFSRSRLVMIPNPVAAPGFVRVASPERVRVGVMARLVERKGLQRLDGLLAALEAEPIEWHVFGDGPLRAQLEGGIRFAHPRAAVTFHGFVADLDRVFSTIDVLLFVSDEETFGLPLAEAMAYGVPIAGYLEDEAPAWVAETAITYRAEARSVEAVTAAVRAAAAATIDIGERRRSHEAWQERFSPDRVAEMWAPLLWPGVVNPSTVSS